MFLSILETPSDIYFNPFEIEKIKLEGLIEIWVRSIWISLRFWSRALFDSTSLLNLFLAITVLIFTLLIISRLNFGNFLRTISSLGTLPSPRLETDIIQACSKKIFRIKNPGLNIQMD